jgi:hypothetical protein
MATSAILLGVGLASLVACSAGLLVTRAHARPMPVGWAAGVSMNVAFAGAESVAVTICAAPPSPGSRFVTLRRKSTCPPGRTIFGVTPQHCQTSSLCGNRIMLDVVACLVISDASPARMQA